MAGSSLFTHRTQGVGSPSVLCGQFKSTRLPEQAGCNPFLVPARRVVSVKSSPICPTQALVSLVKRAVVPSFCQVRELQNRPLPQVQI